MPEEGTFAGISLESITVDSDGRVIVKDPEVAARLRSTSPELFGRKVSNSGCNNVKGCGTGQNVGCTVTVSRY